MELEEPLRKLISEDEFNQLIKIESGEIEKVCINFYIKVRGCLFVAKDLF